VSDLSSDSQGYHGPERRKVDRGVYTQGERGLLRLERENTELREAVRDLSAMLDCWLPPVNEGEPGWEERSMADQLVASTRRLVEEPALTEPREGDGG